MNIVPQNQPHSELLCSKTSNFLDEFHVSRILKACNAAMPIKSRGFQCEMLYRLQWKMDLATGLSTRSSKKHRESPSPKTLFTVS